MTELDILKKQIEALEKLVDVKDRIISDLEKRRANPMPLFPQVFGSPRVHQPAYLPECSHEYPTPWFGITPPPCNKCGQEAPSYTVTCGAV